MNKDSSCGPGPFPVYLLPPSIKGMVEAMGTSAGCGLDLPAVTALGVVGCAIGPGVMVCTYLTKDLPTPTNVFVVMVGISGGGKSRNGGPLFQPIFRYQDNVQEAFKKQALPKLKAEMKVLEREIKALDKQVEMEVERKAKHTGKEAVPVKPEGINFAEAAKPSLEEKLARLYGRQAELRELMHLPQVVMEDFTVQILVRSMARNQGKMLIVSSDARETVNNLMGRYNRGKTDESILLKGWSAERYTYDRKGDNGELVSETIERCLVGIILMIQPDKASELVECAALAAGGFLPRTQIVFTDIDPALPSTLKPLPDDVRQEWNVFIDGLLQRYYAAGSPVLIQLSEEAQAIWNAYADSKVQERNGGEKHAFSFRSRDAETARRYAGILHAGVYGSLAHEYLIDGKTIRSAIQIVEWFDWHRQKVVGFHEGERESKQIKKLQELKATHPRGFTLREVCRKRLAGDDDSQKNQELLDRLLAKGLLISSEDGRGGVLYQFL
jgi:hypothetical protein